MIQLLAATVYWLLQ